MGGTRRVGIKSIELPTSESNGLIKSTPNETQKGLCYVCPVRCGACLLRCVLPCHVREEDASVHQLLEEDRTKRKTASAFSVVGVLFTVKLQI